MNKAELVFKAIDVFGELPQNAVHYPGIVRYPDIAYSDEDKKFNIGDLYFKRTALNDGTLHPVLLYIHGGGFIKGDKDYRVTNSEFFAHHGYFVFNIDYRMPPDVPITDNFADIIRAINYIGELAKKFNIDVNKIAVSGDSSGGYQTAMLAASAFDDDVRKALGLPEIEYRPAALALMCGLYDLQQLLNGPSLFGVIPETASLILGFKVKKDMSNLNDYEYIDFTSPVHLVNSKWCPTFMTWSEEDIICVGQGPTMAQALNDNGVKNEIFAVKGIIRNHCYHLMLNMPTAKECMNRCVNFLNGVLDHNDPEEEPINESAEAADNGAAPVEKTKRIVTVQDISCVGKCSLTVALPIISACGVETAVIPTAVLSTHTAFKDFTFHDLTNEITPIAEHWKKENFTFDAIYTGYLGSFEQLHLMSKFFDDFRTENSIVFVDPVMADNGRLYPGFTQEFADEMAKLCGKADIIVPNLTEACFMLHREYIPEGYSEDYIRGILKDLAALGAKNTVLTGVSFKKGMLGVMGYISAEDRFFSYYTERIDVSFHGTGDVFASACVGALMRGLTLENSLKTAANYTLDSIRKTVAEPNHNTYGVNFEQSIPLLLEELEKNK